MEKRQYIAPMMEAAEIEAQTMMAASNVVSISNEVTTDDAIMGNERRGSWGNLWGSDR
jgi:hypothetical protein